MYRKLNIIIVIYSSNNLFEMPQSFSDGDKIYSVDMMFAYINIFKPKKTKIDINTLIHNLSYTCWGGPNGRKYSPMDVLNNKGKYSKEVSRIKKADLKYPIILNGDNIVDGAHRLTKAMLKKQKYKNAYVFSKQDMKLFLVDKARNWSKIDKIEIHQYIELFYKHFLAQ